MYGLRMLKPKLKLLLAVKSKERVMNYSLKTAMTISENVDKN
jgi:hypothetical protein